MPHLDEMTCLLYIERQLYLSSLLRADLDAMFGRQVIADQLHLRLPCRRHAERITPRDIGERAH